MTSVRKWAYTLLLDIMHRANFRSNVLYTLLFIMLCTLYALLQIGAYMQPISPRLEYNSRGYQNRTRQIFTAPNTLDNAFVDIIDMAGQKDADPVKMNDLLIIVLTMDRPASLQRLLSSLLRAKYGTRVVELRILQDTLPDGSIDARTKDILESFEWKQGRYRYDIKKSHQGVMNMWLNAWIPESPEDLAVILEDDTEVSPYFAKWLIRAHKHFIVSKKDPEVCSLGLSRPTVTAVNFNRPPKTLDEFITTTSPAIKYQMPSSWGLAPSAQHWKEFREWFIKSYNKLDPYIRGLDLYEYFKKLRYYKKEHTLWTIWYVAFSDLKGCYTVYPHINKPFKLALIKNHQEKGLHNSIKIHPDNEILHVWSDEYTAFPKQLPKYSYSGRVEAWMLV